MSIKLNKPIVDGPVTYVQSNRQEFSQWAGKAVVASGASFTTVPFINITTSDAAINLNKYAVDVGFATTTASTQVSVVSSGRGLRPFYISSVAPGSFFCLGTIDNQPLDPSNEVTLTWRVWK